MMDALVVLLILGGFLVWPMVVWLFKQVRADGNKQIFPLLYLTVYTGVLIGFLLLK